MVRSRLIFRILGIEDTWDLRYPLCTGANCPDSCDVGTTAKVLNISKLNHCKTIINSLNWCTESHFAPKKGQARKFEKSFCTAIRPSPKI